MAAQPKNLNREFSLERGRYQMAEFFRSKRVASGLTAEQVSDGLGFNDVQLVLDYESGKTALPLDDVFALTNFLNIAPEEVMALVFQISSSS